MLYLYRQMRRDYKIKFTDKSKANLWIHLDLAKVHRLKGLASAYIISYLHFLNLKIFWLPPNFGCRYSWVWFDTNYVRLVFCLPDLHACALVFEIKTNASRLFRGVFRTQSNIYDGALLWKQFTAKSRKLFLQKDSIVDVRLGSKIHLCKQWFALVFNVTKQGWKYKT